jgi:hypothetical protein
VSWWVHVTPEVKAYIQTRGFTKQSPDKILAAVTGFLSVYGDECAIDRWNTCPDDFFVYSHLFIDGGRMHTLKFVVKDATAEQAVLQVVWVEHIPGDVFP